MKKNESISVVLWNVIPKFVIGGVLIYSNIKSSLSWMDLAVVATGLVIVMWGLWLSIKPKFSNFNNNRSLKAFISFSIFLIVGVIVDSKVDSVAEITAIVLGIILVSFVWMLKFE
jgi:hypothetical protein